MTNGWATTAELAAAADIDRRRALRALVRAFKQSKTWRGSTLIVSVEHHRQGYAGLNYKVLVSSLPLGLQEELRTYRAAFEAPSKPRDDTAAERDWWSLILAPAIAQPKHSRERAAAIADLLSRLLTDWQGQPIAPSARTIHRKLDLYEKHGIAGLAGRQRRDKGTTHVVLSDRWDSAVPFDQATREKITEKLRAYIRGLHKDDAAPKVIGMLAARRLAELTNAAGFPAPADAGMFAVPRAFIEGERVFRNVAVFNKDRKAYEDAKPRIRRTREGLAPMQLVCGDVHHLDIVMRRPDGTEAWPKAIAWLDLATNRIRLDLMLLGKGEGIRNTDVIASFCRMVAAWGMPRGLYLDNGSEYRWSEFVDDAMHLVERIDGPGDGRESRIVRAQAYNAAAKAVEGIFKVLEYTYFRTLPGWAGGDRTNKKTAKVGKPTDPFPGTLDELRAAIGNCLGLYEIAPQRGAIGNRSPRQVYEAALADGWQKVALDPRQLRTVFAVSEVRRVRQGMIELGGRRWTCPQLAAFLGDRVTVRVPKFEAPAMLPLLDDAGKVFAFAEPESVYAMTDREGARAASRMQRARRSAIRELDGAAPAISTMDEMARMAATLMPAPDAPTVATIEVSRQASEIAAAMAEAPEDRAARRRREAQEDALKVYEQTEASYQKMLRANQ